MNYLDVTPAVSLAKQGEHQRRGLEKRGALRAAHVMLDPRLRYALLCIAPLAGMTVLGKKVREKNYHECTTS